MTLISRRNFLASGIAIGGAAAFPTLLPAQTKAAGALTLRATRRVLDVRGKAVSVFGLENGSGQFGLTLDPDQQFRVDLSNGLDAETIIHWHGQIPPNAQDGVPNTNPMLQPGETRSYDFTPRPGTFWMHSHVPAQEVGLLTAPLIIRSKADLEADRQEVTLLLHDLSFKTPEEVLAEVTGGGGMDHAAMGHGSTSMPASGGMDHSNMPGMDMGEMEMDLNDFNFDAYLANDRTLDDPEIVPVDKGGRILLRAINAAAMTAFWLDLGQVKGRLVAVDGEPCQPLTASRFGFASAQRLDIELDMPADGAALPILALREGAREQTGIILAPKGATVPRIAGLADTEHPAFSGDMTQESQLRAVSSLAERPADRTHMVMLGGDMLPYRWTINDQVWGNHAPIKAISGERVELMLHNMSMMAHPMHLHGHVFQVVDINGNRISGALRDTVHVPPMSRVTIAFDAGEAAPWMLHCHHMGHLETGMMTELEVQSA